VVELGPGLGRTAMDIAALKPASYVGVDDSGAASARVQQVVAATGGRTVHADAASTGLEAVSADVVVGEAMLTMQGEKAKKAIVAEAFRVLRPGGRYAIHELGLTPDTLAQDTKEAVRRDLARAIKVNARPLTVAEWTELLNGCGFEVESVDLAPMALLRPRRVIADEGLFGALRIVTNVLTHPAARKRVLSMRRTFTEYRDALTAVAIVAAVPAKDSPAMG
jgi:SAM-dependent methyltransferase